MNCASRNRADLDDSVAGSETTATLMCGLMNHLLRNPDIMKKLTTEIREHIKHEDDLVIKNLSALPYMDACLEEGLRIFPPVPIGLLRIVPKGGSEIDGHMIPAGVSIPILPPFFPPQKAATVN